MEIKNSILPLILGAIGKMQTTNLNGADIANIIKAKRAIQDCADVVYQTQETILKNNGIEPNSGVSSWSGHENEEQINSRLGELMNASSSIGVITRLAEDDFYSSVKGLSIVEIEQLSKIFLA